MQYQFSVSPYRGHTAAAVSPKPNPNMARAAELREKLTKGRLGTRAASSTPAAINGTLVARPAAVDAGTTISSAPKSPATQDRERRDREINELISNYSAEKAQAAESSIKQETKLRASIASLPSKIITSTDPTAKPQAPLEVSVLGNSPKVDTPNQHQRSRSSQGSISEGEIVEHTPKSGTKPTPTDPKTQAKANGKRDQSRKPGNERAVQALNTRTARDEPRHAGKQNTQQRNRDGRRDDEESQGERRISDIDHRIERRGAGYEREHYEPRYVKDYDPKRDARRNSRDDEARRNSRDEEIRRVETRNDPARDAHASAAGTNSTFLSKALEQDPDLKEWLEATGWHDVEHRTTTLSAHRELVQLDIRRRQLTSKVPMFPFFAVPQPGASSIMAPPPVITNNEGSPFTEKSTDQQREVGFNKRQYSEVNESRDDGPGAKRRIKDDEDSDRGRPDSRGYNSPRRYERSRSRDRKRNNDDGRRGFGPAQGRDDRSFVKIGGYEGHNYDPDYQANNRGGPHNRGGGGDSSNPRWQNTRGDSNRGGGGGRGRGRGNFDSGRNEPFGGASSTPNGKPWKDTKALDRGGTGG